MKKIEKGTKVRVDGIANQWPFERVVDNGIVIDNAQGYLVRLERGRENLMFKRRELTSL